MIISFGWTTPALLAGQKTVTRRDWHPKHAAHFSPGQLVDAWNTSPRNVQGNPHKVAVIRILDLSLQSTAAAPDSDWEAEGFEYLTQHGILVDGHTPGLHWTAWRAKPRDLYVVRFEVVEYLEGPLA